MSIFNTVPGLIPLPIFNGNDLVTSNVNLINFTGSGVTASVGEFNNLTVTIDGGGGGGGTTPTGSLLLTASFSNPNLTFTKGDGSTFNVNLSTLVPTSSSYALSSSYAATASIATSSSYALNGGVTQLLAGPNIVLSPISGLGQVTVTANLSGSTIFNTSTGSYGSFYDTTTQTNLIANIPRSMSFNNTDITNGVSISGSTSPFNTYIKTQNAGVYDIQFSAQLDKTDSGTDEIVIWLRKNGIDLTDTATAVTLVGNNAKNVAAWNWFVTSAANDYYQIIWQSADTNVRLFAEPADGHPGIPSVIATVNRVDQFLSNTGSFSGSFNGSFTGSLLGTASYATNALSASFAPSTPAFPFTGSAQITGSLGVTGSVSIASGSLLIVSSSFNGIGLGSTAPSANLHINNPLNNSTFLRIDKSNAALFDFIKGGSLNSHAMRVFNEGGSAIGQLGAYNSSDVIAYNMQGVLGNTTNDATAGIYFTTTGAGGGGNPSFQFRNLSTVGYALYAGVVKPALIRLQGTHGASSGTGEYAAIRIANTINQTGGTGINYGIIYEPTITSITGTHYGLVVRPSGTLNGIGLGSSLPTATWHVKGNSDTTGDLFIAESLSSTNGLTVASTGLVTAKTSGGGSNYNLMLLQRDSNTLISFNSSGGQLGIAIGTGTSIRVSSTKLLIQGTATAAGATNEAI